jgi:hypothetical protein
VVHNYVASILLDEMHNVSYNCNFLPLFSFGFSINFDILINLAISLDASGFSCYFFFN